MPLSMPSVEELALLEKSLVFPQFSCEDAMKLGLLVVERAKRENKIIAVSVSIGRQTVFQFSLDGLAPNSDNWIRRKSNVVYQFRQSSLLTRLSIEQKGSSLEVHGLSSADYVLMGGSVPIRVKGADVVGAITVTGLDHLSDHEYVVDAITRYIASMAEKDEH
ncbi:heme-degrading domain-containing protein [Oscillospiraceae bacterium MB08-C2-2]|nr:heme-degrading domain-containing protein [Oscillospiraceae bacterium MB08-C2-2]